MEVSWAQERVSGHKGLSVGTWRCQWAHGSVSGHTDVLVGTKACQWEQNSPVNCYKYTLEAVHL